MRSLIKIMDKMSQYFWNINSDGSGDVKLVAGTAVIGEVAIDQTADGTTNKVQARNATHDSFNANANLQVGDADVSAANPVPMEVTGSNFEQALGSAIPTKGILMGISDGTNLRALKSNFDVVLLASAVRAANTASANQTNYNGRALILHIHVATAGTGTITPKILALNPVDGAQEVLVTLAGITVGGYYQAVIGLGVNTVATADVYSAASYPIPLIWGVYMAHSDASNWTYNVSATVII